eukprot:2633820-Amphidinium_carterae.1
MARGTLWNASSDDAEQLDQILAALLLEAQEDYRKVMLASKSHEVYNWKTDRNTAADRAIAPYELLL